MEGYQNLRSQSLKRPFIDSRRPGAKFFLNSQDIKITGVLSTSIYWRLYDFQPWSLRINTVILNSLLIFVVSDRQLINISSNSANFHPVFLVDLHLKFV